MKNTSIIIGTLIVFGVVILLAVLFDRGQMILNETSLPEPVRDPIDVVSEFADAWLDNLNATSAVPLADFLTTQTDVSEVLRTRLINGEIGDQELDPVLCQSETPTRIGVKPVYVTGAGAQVMILPRGSETASTQSIVTLALNEGEWLISDISCSFGETGGLVGEYSFEQIGRLAKDSIPERYDQSLWHVLFSNELGDAQIVPLFFDAGSQCERNGETAVCEPSQFTEGTIVFVQANMTEAGASVGRMELE